MIFLMMVVIILVPFTVTLALLLRTEKRKLTAVILTFLTFFVISPLEMWIRILYSIYGTMTSEGTALILLPIALLIAFSARKGVMEQLQRIFISMVTALAPLGLMIFAATKTDEIFISVIEIAIYYVIFVCIIYAATKYKKWVFTYVISILGTVLWLLPILESKPVHNEETYTSGLDVYVVSTAYLLIWITYIVYVIILWVKEVDETKPKLEEQVEILPLISDVDSEQEE